MSNEPSSGLKAFFVAAGLLTLAYAWPLWVLVTFAAGTSLHSHILLIPFVSAYLIHLRRGEIRCFGEPSRRLAVFIAAMGVFLAVLGLKSGRGEFSEADYLGIMVSSYLLVGVGLALWFLGWRTLRQILFPVSFLIFLIPLPDILVEGLEWLLMRASADASHWVFLLMGTPVLRSGQVLELPGIVLEVARECSGIRSTWVLFITSILAAYLFLKSPLKRVLLVACVFPLGVLRNALRIGVIGELCVRQGPHMIDSWIHREGGPVFFGISLLPLFLILVLLWKSERKRAESEGGEFESD